MPPKRKPPTTTANNGASNTPSPLISTCSNNYDDKENQPNCAIIYGPQPNPNPPKSPLIAKKASADSRPVCPYDEKCKFAVYPLYYSLYVANSTPSGYS